MDPNTQIKVDCSPLFHQYHSGRVERLAGTTTVPAAFDSATGVTTKDVTIDAGSGITARLYLPDSPNRKLPILVYYHGGGFCIQSAFSPTYQPFLNSLASKANLLVVSVNYRLAPEHPLPAAYVDSWAALKWVFAPGADPWLAEHGDLDSVFVAGDSAGGNISHQMAMRAGRKGKDDENVKLEGMVLIHAYFWGSEPVGSETRDPMATAFLERLWQAVSSAEMRDDLDHPASNPLAEGAPSLAGLGCRRALVCVAEKDVLAERGRAYYEALAVSSGWGGAAEFFVSEGEEHVFHLLKPECKKASELVARSLLDLKWVFTPGADPWLAEHGDLDSVFVAGDSAGMNISHQMAMRAGRKAKDDENVKLEGMVLIHAYFWGSEPVGSETRDPMTTAFLERLWQAVSSAEMRDDLDHPASNPLAEGAPSLAGLGCRRALVCVAERDVLAERGRAYYEALAGSSGWGGVAEFFVSEGEEHVFHLLKPECKKASELVARLAGFFRNGSE